MEIIFVYLGEIRDGLKGEGWWVVRASKLELKQKMYGWRRACPCGWCVFQLDLEWR